MNSNPIQKFVLQWVLLGFQAGFLLCLFPPETWADQVEHSTSRPYIDKIKKEMNDRDDSDSAAKSENSVGYSEAIKKKLASEKQSEDSAKESSGSYIEDLKRSNPELRAAPSQGSFSEEVKSKLEPKEVGGAIQAVKEGRSELKPKKLGEAQNVFGFRYGIVMSPLISASSTYQARSFKDVYGTNYAPDFSFFYEHQFFHSEWFGSLGVLGMAGAAYYSGTGRLSIEIPKPGEVSGAGYVDQTTSINMQSVTVPLTAALVYRFNLLRIVRPYIMAGPSSVHFLEFRSDNGSPKFAASRSLFLSGGAALNLDWIFPVDSWDLYSTYSVKRHFITADYVQYITFPGDLSGDINFGVSGFMLGIAYEF